MIPSCSYIGAMFHDLGLMEAHCSPAPILRFEVDGANAARDFLRSHGIGERDIEDVWTAVALHTTPGIPGHMRPPVALVTARVERDVLGIAYQGFTARQRDQVCAHDPRGGHFKENIIEAFTPGHRQKAAHHLRQRQSQRARAEGPRLQASRFLQHHPGIGLAGLTARLTC
jgi:hypothetical protein